MNRRYVIVRRPWAAAVDVGAPEPAQFYARMIDQALRYGLPGRRRVWPAWVLAARAPKPVRPAGAALRHLRPTARPDLDALVDAVRRDWGVIAGRCDGLPRRPPALSVLALERAAGRTVFLFGDEPHPLVVAKVPRVTAEPLALEAEALRRAEGAAIAPRDLGQVAGAYLQAGVPGSPPVIAPLRLGAAARARWPRELDALAAGLQHLAAMTAERTQPARLGPVVDRALGDAVLDGATRRALVAAWRDVRHLEVSVLRHRDTSPQNCLVVDGRLQGLVDWELADFHGPPGFDVWNAASAWFDAGVGLWRWSEARLLEAFTAAWQDSPFWRGSRAAARDSARAAGVAEAVLDPLEIVFFGSRVGNRLAMPGWHPTGPAVAAAILRAVLD